MERFVVKSAAEPLHFLSGIVAVPWRASALSTVTGGPKLIEMQALVFIAFVAMFIRKILITVLFGLQE